MTIRRTPCARRLTATAVVAILASIMVSESKGRPLGRETIEDAQPRIASAAREHRLSFSGRIDGSEVIEISATHAWWTHRNWGWPSRPVVLDDFEWNPKQNRFLENASPTRFLPTGVDFSTARLANVRARDKVTLEPGPRSVRVHIVDTPNGSGQYDFDIVFPVPVRRTSIHFAADIDGSDTLILTRKGAEWKHRHWSWPSNVVLDNVAWNPRQSPRLKRREWSLPRGVDLSAARLTVNQGRDAAVMETFKDRIVIHFADNPLGRARYDLTIDWPLPRVAPKAEPGPQATVEQRYRLRVNRDAVHGEDPGANQSLLERLVTVGSPFEFTGAQNTRFTGLLRSDNKGGLMLKATLKHNYGTSEFDSSIHPDVRLNPTGGIFQTAISIHNVEITPVVPESRRSQAVVDNKPKRQ